MKPLAIGRILTAHGIRGEVKVELYNPDSEVLLQLEAVCLKQTGQEAIRYEIKARRRAAKHWLIGLAGVDDRTQAELLRGLEVLVERAQLPPLGEDEYYLADLIGATVIGPSGPLGTVIRVVHHPTVDAALVDPGTGTTFEVIMQEPWVSRIDTETRVIELASLEGIVS